MNKDWFTDHLEEKFANEYEETHAGSEHFGTSQTNMIMISILVELKEISRLVYNKTEARQ